MNPRPPRPPAPHERRVFLLALSAGLPGVVATIALLLNGNYAPRVTWTLGGFVLGTWIVVTLVLRERIVRPLQTLSNMLAALREGDFSLRARLSHSDDALGLALMEINLLGDTLRSQRLGALEATSLLRAVMSEIDVAIFAFDDGNRLRLANRAGERLLAQPYDRLAGRAADALGMAEFLTGPTPRVHERTFPERRGRWEVRRTTFRQEGRPHLLLVVTDVTKSLREEELLAWQRLVRVLSHEINNSLAPIKSIAGTLQGVTERTATGEAREDMTRGLEVIASRAESLQRFMSSYARLARLPAPVRRPFDLGALVRRAAGLEARVAVRVVEGPPMEVRGDPDQVEQALINLVRNAADAALEAQGGVQVQWSQDGPWSEVQVLDEGPGIDGTANLFIPFFTTKPEGSGIGLVLSRQIAEGHGGSLALENRADRKGAVARLRLPL
ncbi:MAG: PAS domain-containing sensor histidine kinase [Gemmatimonadetes bacterium]|nr:PAS domain-containing sensor histidine kinase [Gemmatimonadota bacterium]